MGNLLNRKFTAELYALSIEAPILNVLSMPNTRMTMYKSEKKNIKPGALLLPKKTTNFLPVFFYLKTCETFYLNQLLQTQPQFFFWKKNFTLPECQEVP